MNSFPFDIESGAEFLGFYLMIGVLGVLIAKVASHVVLELFDPKLKERTSDKPPSLRPQPEARRDHIRLMVGHFPRADEIHSVAYLRAGVGGVVDSLLARATAEGWLRPERGGSFKIESSPAFVSPALGELKRKLGYGPLRESEARSRTREIARGMEPALRKELESFSLLRTGAHLAAGLAVYFAIAIAVLWIGAVRYGRMQELGRPTIYVAGEILLFAAAFGAFAAPRRTTAEGQRYLRWLADASSTVKKEVSVRRARTHDDVALIAAISGGAAIPALALVAMRSPGDDSGFVTSCSAPTEASAGCSSAPVSGAVSCSSGGGCGGSASCGGGGGCGT